MKLCHLRPRPPSPPKAPSRVETGRTGVDIFLFPNVFIQPSYSGSECSWLMHNMRDTRSQELVLKRRNADGENRRTAPSSPADYSELEKNTIVFREISFNNVQNIPFLLAFCVCSCDVWSSTFFFFSHSWGGWFRRRIQTGLESNRVPLKASANITAEKVEKLEHHDCIHRVNFHRMYCHVRIDRCRQIAMSLLEFRLCFRKQSQLFFLVLNKRIPTCCGSSRVCKWHHSMATAWQQKPDKCQFYILYDLFRLDRENCSLKRKSCERVPST